MTNILNLFATDDKLGSAEEALVIALSHNTVVGCTFADLRQLVFAFQKQIQHRQLNGQQILLLLPSIQELLAAAIAIMRSGGIPVLIDAQLSIAKQVVQARGVGVRRICAPQILSKLIGFTKPLSGIKAFSLTSDWDQNVNGLPHIQDVNGDDGALISFSSSTGGRPKIVERSHTVLAAQHRILQRLFPNQDGDVMFTTFPAAMLRNFLLGVKTLLVSRTMLEPERFSPGFLHGFLQQHHATRLALAPFHAQSLFTHMMSNRLFLPEVREVIIGGAPITSKLAKLTCELFPKATVTGIYGCTEAEPIAAVNLSKVAQEQGEGYLVGAPVSEARVNVMSLDDMPITRGEVHVSGPHVALKYLSKEKTPLRTDSVATGDIARIDNNRQIWLLGRENRFLPSQPQDHFILEAKVNPLDGILRSALVSTMHGKKLVICIELLENISDCERVKTINGVKELAHGRANYLAILKNIPTEKRHYSKIDRLGLMERLKSKPIMEKI